LEFRKWVEIRREVSRLGERLVNSWRFNLRWDGTKMTFAKNEIDYKEKRKFVEYLKEKYSPGRWTRNRVSGWDADHIIPVCEGGGECDLGNYRTLCHPCHKEVTAELAGRRAEARRAKKRRIEGDLFQENDYDNERRSIQKPM